MLQNRLQRPHTEVGQEETTSRERVTQRSTNMLRFYYRNLRSIHTKSDSLFLHDISRFDMFAFPKTWLNASVHLSEFIDTAIDLAAVVGGVALALKIAFDFTQIDLHHILELIPVIDIVVVSLRFAGNIVNILVLFISPGTLHIIVVLLFELSIGTISLFIDKLLVLGDFNILSYFQYFKP